MSKRIKTLTDEQKAMMPFWRDKWIAKGLDISEPDWVSVYDGIEKCYGCANLSWHGRIVRMRSPLGVSLGGPLVSWALSEGFGSNDAKQIVENVLPKTLPPGVLTDIVDALQTILPPTEAPSREKGRSWRPAVEKIKSEWHLSRGGQWWASLHSWVTFFTDVCGLELEGDLPDRAKAYMAAQQAGWWWAHTDFTLIAERPTGLHLEKTGVGFAQRLNCEEGPAIEWADGFELYSWHGIAVPEWVITNPTMRAITSERNTEVRRCAIESFGWDNFTRAAGLKQVDQADDPGNPGQELFLYEVPSDLWGSPIRLLLMTNGTTERSGVRRRYGETVPDTVQTAVAATAWASGVSAAQYQLLARRS